MAKGNGFNPTARPAASFRVPVTIQTEIDGIGIAGAQKQWVPLARAMVSVQSLNGADQWRAGQFTSEGRSLLELRWIPGVKANMRVLFDDGRLMLITSPPTNVGEMNRLLQLNCLEIGGE